MSDYLPIGGQCPCLLRKTTHVVWDEHGTARTTRCPKCAEEMRTLGWLTRLAHPAPTKRDEERG